MEAMCFRGTNRAEVLERIQREVGPEAVVLSQRKVRTPGLKGIFSRRMIEFFVQSPYAYGQGLPEAVSPSLERADADSIGGESRGGDGAPITLRFASDKAPVGASMNAPAKEADRIQELRPELQAILGLSAQVRKLIHPLIEQEIDISLAFALGQEVEKQLGASKAEPREILRQTLIGHMTIAPPLYIHQGSQKVIMVVGPSGTGKTTALIKLAVQLRKSANTQVGIINTDTYRVGAAEQIQTYGKVLRIPVAQACTADEVEQRMEEMATCGVVLIDTAGQNPTDESYRESMLALLSRVKPEEVYLVLSASMGNRICREVIRGYAFLTQYKLILSKLDEALSSHMVYNACQYANMPLAYLTWGQQALVDLEIADPAYIADSLLEQGYAKGYEQLLAV